LRPLSELKVLDFGQYIAGPVAAMLFCDQGAVVTHIDPPGGPRWKDLSTAILNRGKHSLELDLGRAEDRARALSLVAEADLLIENFRPGVMARLGLDAAACHAVNPGLVYLSLPGFASGDPEFRRVAAWEAIIGGAVGQFRDMGLNRVLMGVDPSYSPLTLASAYGGVLGAVAAMTALAAGERGRTIEVPLATALLEGLVFNALHLDEVPERYLGFREREIRRRRQDASLSISPMTISRSCSTRSTAAIAAPTGGLSTSLPPATRSIPRRRCACWGSGRSWWRRGCRWAMPMPRPRPGRRASPRSSLAIRSSAAGPIG